MNEIPNFATIPLRSGSVASATAVRVAASPPVMRRSG